MTSRTPEGKHTKRFIVLKKGVTDKKFVRSATIPEALETKELALAAITARTNPANGITYKVRQK